MKFIPIGHTNIVNAGTEGKSNPITDDRSILATYVDGQLRYQN